MVFAKRFCTAAAAIIFTFVLAIQTFAVSIDGSVSPDEVRSTNVQIQCENENGGNGICALATYYTKTEKGSLYVAINGDISYADLTKESPVVYEILPRRILPRSRTTSPAIRIPMTETPQRLQRNQIRPNRQRKKRAQRRKRAKARRQSREPNQRQKTKQLNQILPRTIAHPNHKTPMKNT